MSNEDVSRDELAAQYFEQICYQLVKNQAQSVADEPPLPSLTVL